MRTELLLAAVAGGVGTYLIRFLPMLAGDRLAALSGKGRWRRFLLALGPSAIVALLVLSARDLIVADGDTLSLPFGVLAAGAAVVVLVQRLTRNPALATLAGALAVGLGQALNFS